MAERTIQSKYIFLFLIFIVHSLIDGLVINVNEDVAAGSILGSSFPVPASGFAYSLFGEGDPVAASLFGVSSTGKITVEKKLNYVNGKRNSYDLIAVKRRVGTSIGGSAEVARINVVDINDHAPIFKKSAYQGHIFEGSVAGSVVRGLEDCFATDEDSAGISRYVITSGNNDNFFVAKVKDISGLKLLQIETTRALDREALGNTPYIDLEVQAVDGGKPGKRSTSANIRIQILDQNDNAPVFDQTTWRATIQENAPIMASVVKVKASDKDEGSNKQLYYYFEDQQDDFIIDPYTGVIYIARALSYDDKNSYKINVVVTDRAVLNPLKSSSNVHISLVKVAGYPTASSTNTAPMFAPSTYEIKVRGDLPIKAFVLLPRAIDQDGIGNNNGKLTFSITSPDANNPNLFVINSKSGAITVDKKLPTPSKPVEFTVTAEDGGTLKATTIVKIEILAINQNKGAPVFKQSTVNVVVAEDASPSTQVFKAEAVDGDLVTYSIVGGSGLGRFQINEDSGVVTPKVTFKSLTTYDLYVEAKDKNQFKLSSMMYARVNVRSSKASSPVFTKAMYVGYVNEGEMAGSFVTAIYAQYPDPSKNVKYKVTNAGGAVGLMLDPNTGIVTTDRTMDFELDEKKTLEIEASVAGSVTKTVVDVFIRNKNDEAPYFTRSFINLQVLENLGYIPNLVCMFAVDKDGSAGLTYSIKEGNVGGLFKIDPKTGQLSVKNLDYETRSSYTIKIEATDGKNIAEATLKVSVGDDSQNPEPPHFGSYNDVIPINEGAPAQTVQDLPVLAAAGSFTCDFGFDVTPDILNKFMVKTKSSSCLIETTGNLKWTKEAPSYKFTVRTISKINAMQATSAGLTVNINDANDHTPVFSQESYAVSVLSTIDVGTSVVTVSASDEDGGKNGEVIYAFLANDDSNSFNLDANTGIIKVKKALQSGKEYRMNVRASDKGATPKSKDVSVKIGSHASGTVMPKFDNLPNAASAREGVSSGTVTSAKATIPAGTVEYSIVGGNKDYEFAIDKNGIVYVNQKVLDRERVAEYKLVVRAAKQGASPILALEKVVTISIIDVNDNEPEFNVRGTPEVTIQTNAPKDTVVSMFRAFDKDAGDNGKLTYLLLPGAGESSVPFAANIDTGIVTTNQILTTKRSYNVILKATDKGSPSRSKQLNIKINMVDGSSLPSFQESSFRITMEDNMEVGKRIGDVSIKDSKSGDFIHYELVSGNQDNNYCIDYDRKIYVQKPVDLDKLSKAPEDMTVTMKFKNSMSAAQLYVIKSTKNDNVPVFVGGSANVRKVLPENAAKGTHIYQFQASDLDDPKSGVVYSIYQVGSAYTKDRFAIDSVNGLVTLQQSLDFEQLDKHVITIQAKERTGSNYALKNLIVEVTDVNDEAPVFSVKTGRYHIPKDAKKGARVLQVFASDLDSGTNGQITYKLANDKDEIFNIDPVTGVVTLNKIIANYDRESFTITVMATDKGKPSKTGQAGVTIDAVTNDGPPKFALSQFKFEYDEGQRMSGKTKAISVDVLTYSILSGNIKNRFKIDKAKGYITSVTALDAEEGTKYTLVVQAKDTSERSATAEVSIIVKNLNDNEPMFRNAKNGLIEKVVSNEVTTGEILVTVEGYDLDVKDRLTYEIVDKEQKKNFEIGANNGQIKLKKGWATLEAGKNFAEFDVKAIDRGTPPKSKTVRVRIVFANFKSDHVKIVKPVAEDASVSSTAVISDLPRHFPRGGYQIIYPKNHPFKISEKTGEMSLTKRLDFETVEKYDIVIQENNYNQQEKIKYLNYRLEVKVIDVNDNPPIFDMKSLSAKVNKNARPGTEVIKLVANDADSGDAGRISYDIVTKDVPFTVNPVTHFIEVSKLNSLTKLQYDIKVAAVDSGVPQKRSTQEPVITINVVNDPPLFEKSLYKFKTSENADVETVVGTIKARSLSGIAVTYKIDSGNLEDKFRVDNKGNVIVQRPLDFETDPSSFSLVISAVEIAASSLKASTNVIIELINVNDNDPLFTEIVYKAAEIAENVPINTLILTVSATDKDCGKTGICIPGSLIYSTDQFKDTFKLDPMTGRITNIKSLDYETKKKYEFEVKVEDSGLKKRTAKAKVVITLKGVNDNPPVFSPKQQTLYIAEGVARGVNVTVVKATDADNDQLTYSIKDGDRSAFGIDSRMGIVSVLANPLRSWSYKYTISASDGKQEGLFDLVINIDDKNDKSPVFSKCDSYKPVVSENKDSGTLVLQVSASDADFDRSGQIEYTLLQVGGKTDGSGKQTAAGGTGSSQTLNFNIDKDGKIRTNGRFDRETKDTYTLIAIARDGGANRTDFERNSAACELNIKILDENDNKPVFTVESYDVSIWDKTPTGTGILLLTAIDKDVGSNAVIEYSLAESSAFFSIPDKTKGEITVKSDLSGNTGKYILRVNAANPGTDQASTVSVKITVGTSEPPTFSSKIYRTKILESLAAGNVLPSLAVTATSQSGVPNAKIVYSSPRGTMVESNLDTFTIDSNNGQIKVAGELNYETTKNYILYVQAKDESNEMVSNAIVYIDILDVNDNSPIFHLSKFEFQTVNEGESAGAVVGQIYASDKDSTTNAELVYFITKEEHKRDFSIDSRTGILTTKRSFDREVDEKVTIHVYAKDKGTKSLSNNVYVTIKIIDLNDNAPVLDPASYSADVKESAAIGYHIVQIKATDRDAGDNAKVKFYITSGNEDGYFSTSSSTFSKGVSTANIIVAKPLDRETKDTFSLTITATDSKYSVTGKVNIKVTDANDNAPAFLKDFYIASIKENVKSGVYVTTVKAVDTDTAASQGPIRYSLSKDVEGMFVIDAVTGVISTGSKSFDREKKQLFRFTVIASDGTLQGTAIVQCTIQDVNDEKPYFPGAPYTRYVEENQPRGTIVGYVPAKDNDDPNEGGNAKIKYSIVGPDQGFEINQNTGLVKTKKMFDREATDHSPVYKITVRATDSGVPVQMNETVVTIVITDANDNAPKFTKASFSGKVAECAAGGTVITKVTAVDKDDVNTVNAQLLYYVISSSHNSEKYFHVNSRTGVVTVAHGLDYEKSGTYKLKVGVKDRGVPQLPVGREESTTVDIVVTDCNDNRPVFVPDNYKVSVPENIKAGSTILTVTAVDKDKGSNGEFTFGIVDAEANFQFGISSATQSKGKGTIKLLYPVDREAVSQHFFKVSASDMGIPKQTGYATVEVNLIDINDNGPHFDKPDYCGRVDEEVTGVQMVQKIKVSDPDTSKYSCPCTFKFESGDTALFEMRSADGNSVEIVTKSNARFDREKKQLYTIYIAAFDQGTPPMKNVTTLKVDVHDKNDNVPSSGGDLSLLVNAYQGKFIGGPVGKVYIKDDDRGSHDLYEHSLTSQSPGKYFNVGKKTGDIIAAANVPAGKYKLSFRSKELNRKVGGNQGKSVVSSATVTVRTISEKQAKTSVAIRMQGLTKPGTCDEMPLLEFENILAKILGVPVEMVTVFSAQPVKGMHRGVDVRFAVKKSAKPGYAGDDAEYLDKSTLVPLLNSKIAAIEKATGGKVASVGIDPCAKEPCQVGFCYNDIQPQRSFQIVTDDNGIVPANPKSKTFISIDVNVIATCLTDPRKPKSCKDKPCLYGGKCKDLITGGYSCSCPKRSYDGPECQTTLKSFKTAKSYLWVKPLNYFFEGVLSFEFGTKEANGVILYQGPVHRISSTETKDFLAIDLNNGRLRVTVNQGDTYRNFTGTVNTKNKLNDGVFHSVRIYKRGKFITVTVDGCKDAEIVESGAGPSQDRSSCEINGIIGGKFRFINGLNPLQLGGIKNQDLDYPPLKEKGSFAGCIRKVTDNGIVYDLSKTIEERDVGSTCPLFAKCPDCIFGFCRVDQLPFVCICQFGWTGEKCDRRVKSYHYKQDSYTQYTFIKGNSLTWQDKYRSLYQVQVQTKMNGIVVYEASPTTNGSPREFSILEIVNKQLQYRYNVGGGTRVLILRGFNASDNKWHNVTVDRRGNYAVLTLHGVGQVSGTVGGHMLLDSDGVIYAGGVPSRFNMKAPYDMQGCLADYRVRHTYLDSDRAVERKRVNVEPNGCPCVGIVCLNGGICVAGSPPYCICPPGFTGFNCGQRVTEPVAGQLAVVSKDGYLVMAVLLVVFLLVLVLAALLLASKFAGKKAVPVYIDDDPRDNIMPYHDEGAGEDDFHNYDLERLLKHAGGNRAVANGGLGAGGKDIEHEPLLAREDVGNVESGVVVAKRTKKARFEGANVESVDVARFITSRLEEANSEDAAYPRDTLLHYGYEGEGSDVDDLSELGDSEDESDDDDADFAFLGDWGTKFDNLNKIFNPPTQEFDEDV